MQQAWIISIGTELALGQSVDTNAAWLAGRLAALGIRAARHVTVPDELPALVAQFRAGAREAELVLVTGGLGATADDLTREALSEAAGVPLVEDRGALERIRAFFEQRHRQMPEKNRVQALIPVGGDALHNPSGTAPGIALRVGDVPFFVLPGVPSEMREMFALLEPTLRAAARGRVIRSRILHCIGATETELGERIADLMARGRNPEVGTTAKLGVIGVRINATGASAESADKLLDADEAEVRSRLARVVFGRDDETLSGVVGAQLAQRGETVCTAESCTGGLIAAALTDTPGASRYFLGAAIAYENAVKQRLLRVAAETLAQHGAVSAATAEAMARGARDCFGATYGLSATGVAGPGGGTPDKPVGLVYVALAAPGEASSREIRFGSDASRAQIRARTVLAALNMLRLRLPG